MGLPRSTFYKAAPGELDQTALVEHMHAIRGEFPAYGCRRITAQLQAEGRRVNRKPVARLMRLQRRCRGHRARSCQELRECARRP